MAAKTNGWQRHQLGEIASFASGFGFSDRFQGNHEGDLPFFKVSDMSTPGNERCLTRANHYVSRNLAAAQAWKPAPSGAVVFAKVGAALMLNRRRVTVEPSLIDNNMLGAVAGALVDSAWLYWWFQTVDFGVFVQPGVVPSVNQGQLSALSVDVPPLPEQRQIAAILDTADEAIRRTEQIIAKLKQVKQGLLHDLLTRGIDDNGELRDPERHPEQFKDSPLGRIPKGWEVALLDIVATRGSGHTPSKNVSSYWNGGIKWVSLADSSKLDRVHIWETDKEISELGIANSSAVRHPPGTVILSRDAGVGKSAVLGCEMAVSQHFIAWRCGPRLNNYFLYYWLQHEKPRFEAIAMGSTIKTIGLPYFRKLKIQVPSRQEQDAAASLWLTSEQCHEKETRALDKLRLLKAGLMEDLLTGRVRVTDLLESAAQ